VALIAAALGVLALSSLLVPQLEHGFRGPPNPQAFPSDIGNYVVVRFALSAINLLLVVYLLFIHVRDYIRLKSSFTLGLVVFLFSFLLYALSTFPLVHMLLGPGGREAFLSFVPMVFTTLGLLVFAKMSNQ
jgi:hypothetical protein